MEFDTTNLLRPHQVVEAKEELAQISATLNAPPHIRSRISDPGQMRMRRDNLSRELEKSTPRPFGVDERDAAVREFHQLEDSIREGMPSSEEMRRNPPGAVGKQISWNNAKQAKVMRYKHVALRLHAGGDLPADMKFEGDIANIERLRPLTTPGQLGMDGAQIPKTTDYHLGSANSVTLSEAEIAAIQQLDPALAKSLALLTPGQREAVKEVIQRVLGDGGSVLTPATPAADAIPTAKSLGYNGMKKLAAKNGIKTFGIKTDDLVASLKAAGLISG